MWYVSEVSGVSCEGQVGRETPVLQYARCVLAFTQYCYYLYLMVYGINKEGRWRGVYCVMGAL